MTRLNFVLFGKREFSDAIVQDRVIGWKEGNDLFNDALNTFYLR